MSGYSEIKIPYGKGFLTLEVEEPYLNAVLTMTPFSPSEAGPDALVKAAMATPYGGKTLEELARGKKTATVIISDHTRPVPSRHILPHMLGELRRGNPAMEITLLVATGCHRDTTVPELREKLGDDILARERIVVHNCDDDANRVDLGALPSGARLRINRLAVETELLVSEGFIEPHFFAGFSGGRKSVLPGVCSRTTVLGNHCSGFIADPHARAGILDKNPIHRDMAAAAEMAKLAYIVNVVNDEEKNIAAAFAGAPALAHAAGCDFLLEHCQVPAVRSDIVVTSNGGYPLDQDVYQAVKSASTAAECAAPGGVIIVAAACQNGLGGEPFYRFLKNSPSPTESLAEIMAVPQDETLPDQWQYQILLRIMEQHPVILVCEWKPEEVREMGFLYAASLGEAVQMAREIRGEQATFTVLPDGVAVIPLN